jgi:hypothetical protein
LVGIGFKCRSKKKFYFTGPFVCQYFWPKSIFNIEG